MTKLEISTKSCQGHRGNYQGHNNSLFIYIAPTHKMYTSALQNNIKDYKFTTGKSEEIQRSIKMLQDPYSSPFQ